MERIVGRDQEKIRLDKIWRSPDAEFIAIYGRRRVGKTHLVREFFESKGPFLELTGQKDCPPGTQLENFSRALARLLPAGPALKIPAHWREAMEMLTGYLENHGRGRKITCFFDELPWLASRKSGIIESLDYYWNTRWSRMPNLRIIVCGSAASWMLERLIHAQGGLHNRLTGTLHLKPFTLREARSFLWSRGIKLNHWQVLELYLCMGGIPHYLKQVEKGKTSVQNIDQICFSRNGLLLKEFHDLFPALFEQPETHMAIVREAAKHRYGIPRDLLLERTGLSSGGTFRRRLDELEAGGFITRFIPYGKKSKEQHVRVSDEYILFYLKWVEPFSRQNLSLTNAHYWETKSTEPAWKSWAGYAFEAVCYKHVEQIRTALELGRIGCEVGWWRHLPGRSGKGKGVQIDLLFDRRDGAISVCEIKFSPGKFEIDRAYAGQLRDKMSVFEEQRKTGKQYFLEMITPFGVKPNVYSRNLVANEVLLPALFR